MTRLPAVVLLAIVIVLTPLRASTGQFSIPLPQPTPPGPVFREDMQMLFHKALFRDRQYDERVKALRELAKNDPSTLLDSAEHFCRRRFGLVNTDCEAALQPDSILKRFGRDTVEMPLTRVYIRSWIPLAFTSRPEVADYLRESNGNEAFAIASQFTANVGQDEAYVVSNIVRGLISRGIFSADQALVVTRSAEANAQKRDTIESDKANALRAINNGGTLVGKYTTPLYARAGSTVAMAVGLTVGAGVLGPITGDNAKRTGEGSGVFEWLMGLPVRDLAGNSNVVADLLIGVRAGYTIAGRGIRESGEVRDLSFGQVLVGLRQNGTMSVSALVTMVNHGMNDLVPRLVVNFAAQR